MESGTISVMSSENMENADGSVVENEMNIADEGINNCGIVIL